MTLMVWRYPILDVYRTGSATSSGGSTRPVRWVWVAAETADYFPCDVPLENLFTFGASDYDMSDDEMYCPCGATLPAAMYLGDRLDDAREHVRKEHAQAARRRR